MRILMEITLPLEPFNTYVREGTAGGKLRRILDETKPESIYFTERDGCRGAVAVYDLARASGIPKLAEPWFLTFDACCQFKVAMTPDDLQASGLDELGRRWAVPTEVPQGV